MENLSDIFEPIRQVVYDGKPKVGVHVNWNAPRGESQPAWEILLGILSACYWTSHNGPIDLYTDEIGMKNVQDLGLEGLYRNIKLLDPDLAAGLDPRVFWASGKFMAMLECDEPAYFIDQDLLLTKTLETDANIDVEYLHREMLNPMWYPKSVLGFISKHFGNPQMDFAYNCALIHFSDVDTMRKYAGACLRFMANAPQSVLKYPPNALMSSVEQFGLQQFSVSENLVTKPLIRCIYDSAQDQDLWLADNGIFDIEEAGDWMYHSWAEKHNLRKDYMASIEFSMNVVNLLERKLGVSLEPLLSKMNFREH